MPIFTRRELAYVEAYRLPPNSQTAISDGMWIWMRENGLTEDWVRRGSASGDWVVMDDQGYCSTLSDDEFRTTYKPLED
tara:strand:+ start:120 stop:356 length:237 start_codon:yes stop_codon:yes gene_type:complete